MRVCRRCNESKLNTEFYWHSKRGYHEAKCKMCFKAAIKIHADANREVVRARNRTAGQKFREANRESENLRVLDYYRKNNDKCRAKNAEWKKANPHLNTAKENKRRASKLRATPKWANLEMIESIYKESAALSKSTGTKMHVDHIIPLKSKLVCGLHCEANLQILPAKANLSKSNRFEVA